MPYLLAAEADKIQDFIFRSSRLREVVGASQLLTRFCRSIDDTLAKKHGGQVVVNDGGSFRVIFDDLAKAHAFGADLAELYRLALGGSLTVAEPVRLDGDFRKANEQAGERLRWAKSRRQGAIAEVHMPYVAFCASCGVALARKRERLTGRRATNRSSYICEACRAKAAERDRKPRAILDELYEAYCTSLGTQPTIDLDWPEDADDIARLDLRQRNYVAYLVADGNSMGRTFGMCDRDQLKELSERLAPVLQDSLALAAASFRKVVAEHAHMIPMIPLILGGDDLFALIPAPYALDFARRFCLEWEQRMKQLVDKIGLTDLPHPTVAAAVVICKSTYPFALAHRRSEALLKEAKRQSKLLTAETGEHLSAVNFEVILGNRLAGQEDDDAKNSRVVRPTLRPYWVCDGNLSQNAQERGFEIKTLLSQRLALKDIPNKRLAELRRCFEDIPASIEVRDRNQKMQTWTNRQLDSVLHRLSTTSREKLEAALAALGKPRNASNSDHHWREIRWGDATPFAHGMLDLLESWDFAQDLEYRPDDYEPQEEEA